MSSNENIRPSITAPLTATTKEQVITAGLEYLSGVGVEPVCRVCISSGASCCSGCSLLNDGVGCQQRNTSCTAWLCGFQKFIFYQAGLINEWNTFWEQVPGQGYRQDSTPSEFTIDNWIEAPDIRHLTEAFALDLEEQRRIQFYPFWIFELKDSLDRYVDQILACKDPHKIKKIERKISKLTYEFYRYREAKASSVR